MKADAAPVQNWINRIFRCRHRRKTFPFTPRGEAQCYAVCLDCGQRIAALNPILAFSSAPSPVAQLPKRAAESPRPVAPSPNRTAEPPRPVIAAPKPAPPPNSSNQRPQKTAAPPSKSRRKAKHKVPQPVAPAQGKAVAKDSSQHVFALRDGRYNLLWVALFAIGLSGGLYFSNRIKSQLPASAPVAPLVQSNPPIGGGQTGAYAVSPASLPDERSRAPAAPPEIQSPGAQSAHGNAPAPSAGSAEVHSKPRLEGKGSLVILGVDAPAIHDLSQHPGRLPELVQSGSLFTAPRGAAVQVEETANGVLKVLLLEGAMAGREGWVPASQVTR